MIETIKYTAKVWLTTVLIPPLIFAAFIAFEDPVHINVNIAESTSAFIILVLFSAVLSFIPCLLSVFVVYFILLQGAPGIKARLYIQLYGLSASTITLLVLFGVPKDITDDTEIWVFILPYMLCLVASIHFYQLPQLYTDQQQQPTT